ncbi:AraC family transcriptional regulator [Vulgatibacter incomptus]|uniref:AraC family transcriptional regulator n=1 Tax=Vulgatibacter incomptus TaxID=1391653 RepID=UPI00068211D7|nr:AraC family transcriptional regulator [Vulgatibacter incomptus]
MVVHRPLPEPERMAPPHELRGLTNFGYTALFGRDGPGAFELWRLPAAGAQLVFAEPRDGPPRLFASGPLPRAQRLLPSRGPIRAAGIELRPAATSLLLGGIAASIQGQPAVPLAELWGQAALELTHRLGRAPPGARPAILFEALEQRMRREPPANVLVVAAVELIETTAGTMRMDRIAERIGVTTRHLLRLFDRHVGCSPKQVARLARFARLRSHLAGSAAIDWAGLAAELGYADQSHLIADFRRLLGETPEQFLSRPLQQRALDLGWLIRLQLGAKPSPELVQPAAFAGASCRSSWENCSR